MKGVLLLKKLKELRHKEAMTLAQIVLEKLRFKL